MSGGWVIVLLLAFGLLAELSARGTEKMRARLRYEEMEAEREYYRNRKERESHDLEN